MNPGVGHEPSGAGRTHHVAAPEGIDAEDGVAQDFGEVHRIMVANYASRRARMASKSLRMTSVEF